MRNEVLICDSCSGAVNSLSAWVMWSPACMVEPWIVHKGECVEHAESVLGAACLSAEFSWFAAPGFCDSLFDSGDWPQKWRYTATLLRRAASGFGVRVTNLRVVR